VELNLGFQSLCLLQCWFELLFRVWWVDEESVCGAFGDVRDGGFFAVEGVGMFVFRGR